MIVMEDRFYLHFKKCEFVNENFNRSVKEVSLIAENLNNFERHADAFESILKTFPNAYISKLDVIVSLSIKDTIKALRWNKIKTINFKSNQKDSFSFKSEHLIF